MLQKKKYSQSILQSFRINIMWRDKKDIKPVISKRSEWLALWHLLGQNIIWINVWATSDSVDSDYPSLEEQIFLHNQSWDFISLSSQ